MSLLEIDKINVYYGDIHVLKDVSLKVNEGEIVSIVGSNGAGKSTLLNTISGIIHPKSGQIKLFNERIDNLRGYKIANRGLIQVPEGRRLFPFMTVLENLEMGAYAPRAKKEKEDTLREIFELLPVLEERRNQLANTLSGGEQQMLAVGRGLMAKPQILMLDEPSLGLAPILVKSIFEVLRQINQKGITIFLVEQNVHVSLSLSDRGYVLENGRIAMEGKGTDLLQDAGVKKAYLGR